MTRSALEQLAEKHPERRAILEARASRAKSRTRKMICTACGENEYSDRDSVDVCDHCLENIWAAQNVLAGEYRRGRKGGLRPTWLTNVDHWLDYPGLEHRSGSAFRTLPEPFGRGDNNDTMRTLFVELFAALAEALPADPQNLKADDVEPLLAMNCSRWSAADDSAIVAMFPAKAADALRDLWAFIRWHSRDAYQAGYDAGHDLLMRLNNGEITADAFSEEIAEQTARAREAMAKIAGRGRNSKQVSR